MKIYIAGGGLRAEINPPSTIVHGEVIYTPGRKLAAYWVSLYPGLQLRMSKTEAKLLRDELKRILGEK